MFPPDSHQYQEPQQEPRPSENGGTSKTPAESKAIVEVSQRERRFATQILDFAQKFEKKLIEEYQENVYFYGRDSRREEQSDYREFSLRIEEDETRELSFFLVDVDQQERKVDRTISLKVYYQPDSKKALISLSLEAEGVRTSWTFDQNQTGLITQRGEGLSKELEEAVEIAKLNLDSLENLRNLPVWEATKSLPTVYRLGGRSRREDKAPYN